MIAVKYDMCWREYPVVTMRGEQHQVSRGLSRAGGGQSEA